MNFQVSLRRTVWVRLGTFLFGQRSAYSQECSRNSGGIPPTYGNRWVPTRTHMTSAPVGFWHWHCWHVRGLWQRSGVECCCWVNLSSSFFKCFSSFSFFCWDFGDAAVFAVSLISGEFLKFLPNFFQISIPVQLKVTGFFVLTSLETGFSPFSQRRNSRPAVI